MAADRDTTMRGLSLIRHEIHKLEKDGLARNTKDLASGEEGYHEWTFDEPREVEVNGTMEADVLGIQLANPCGHIIFLKEGTLRFKGFAPDVSSFVIET